MNQTTNHTPSLSEIAHDLLLEDLNPLPLKADKSPALPKGHNYLYERMKDADVDHLFRNAKKIGIACGEVSDGFYCLDFDAHNEEPIKDIFEDFIKIDYIDMLIQDGKLAGYSTMSGGYHLYFKLKQTVSGQALARWQNKSVMIEIRGNGQYTACYPSAGYTHILGQELIKIGYIDDKDYTVITDLSASFNRYEQLVTSARERANTTGKKWAESWKSTTPHGKYNIECEDEAKELLFKHGWQQCEVRKDGVEYWTRPNKDPKDGFSATYGHQKGMFYVFSEDANCEPFQTKQGYSPFGILTALKFDGDWKRAKDSLRERFNMVDNEQFWSISDKGNYSLNNKLFKDFLEDNDFFKNTPNDLSTYDFIKRDGMFLNIVYEKDIKDFILDWIEDNQAPDGVFNLMTGNLKFFKREYLSMLKTKTIKTMKDTKNECFMFYKNCIIKITKDKKQILTYQDQNLAVWKDQIINRDYEPADHHKSEYRAFIWKISGEDKDKYKALQTTIGYLIHTFKTNSNNKAIIFNDELISDTPNGRSGKGLFWNALKQLRKVQSLDGKNFDFNKAFPYQNVSTDCQILVFDDVKKNFNFESLFSVITEGITIEYKGKDSIKLDVTESPKIIITTNYTIKGDSASANARKYEVELSSYFNDSYTPVDEFGHELFNDWDEAEWARFDSYMMECTRIYLECGLKEMPTKNLAYRKLIDEISLEMYHFFDSLERNEWLKIKAVYDRLIVAYPEIQKYTSQNKMTTNFKKYCKFHELKHDTRYSGGIGMMIIETEADTTTTTDTQPLNDDIPF